nr:redoxin domain-containing protein [Paenibacillus azoreducens]
MIYSRTSGISVGEPIPFTDFLPSEPSGAQVLIFGKPTCSACRKLLMQIQKEKLHQSINISVLYQDSESEQQEFSQQKHFSFPIKTITKEQKSLFKIEVAPYTYVIDKQGIIRYKGVLSSREIVNAYKFVQATT